MFETVAVPAIVRAIPAADCLHRAMQIPPPTTVPVESTRSKVHVLTLARSFPQEAVTFMA